MTKKIMYVLSIVPFVFAFTGLYLHAEPFYYYSFGTLLIMIWILVLNIINLTDFDE